MKPELIIFTNKNHYKRQCYASLTILVIMLLIFFYVRRSSFTGYLSLFAQGFLIISIAIASIYFFYVLYRTFRIAPMAIIDPNGIWIKQFGVIPWSNVQKIDTFQIFDTPVNALGIQVHDTIALSKQATIAGKLIILESKVLKSPTIVLDNLELENQTILSFASQFTESHITRSEC